MKIFMAHILFIFFWLAIVSLSLCYFAALIFLALVCIFFAHINLLTTYNNGENNGDAKKNVDA